MAAKPILVPVRKKAPKKPITHELAGIRHLLKLLRERVGRHPELDDAIVRLEILLSDLTVSSGGML
jgi:hypothetical protein